MNSPFKQQPKEVESLSELESLIGFQAQPTDWLMVDQSLVSAFANTTFDHNFIHVDEIKAKQTIFGGTIAHGFLTLSLLAPMGYSLFVDVKESPGGVNYGLNKLRFLQPVRVGSRIRGHAKLIDVVKKDNGNCLVTYDVSVEIEGEETPALAAQWLVMLFAPDNL